MIDQDYFILFCIACAIWWIARAFGVMNAAQKRGYNSGDWLLTSLLLGPILGALLLIANPAKAPSGEEVTSTNLSTI